MAIERKYVPFIISQNDFPKIIVKGTEYGTYTYFTSTPLIDCKNFSYICNNINVIVRYKTTDLSLVSHLTLDDKQNFKQTYIYSKLTDDMKLFIDGFSAFILSRTIR